MQYIVTANTYRCRGDQRPDPVAKLNTGFRYIEQWDILVKRVQMNSQLRAVLEDDSREPISGGHLWTAEVEICDDLPDGKFYCYSDEFEPIPGMPDIYLQFAD